MLRITGTLRPATAVAVAILLSACTVSDDDVLGPRPAGPNAIFQSYVALGNSITAGFQSLGLTDALQRQSYALLLAQQMRTRYAYASMAGRGCTPPIVNFFTQAGPGTITAAQRPTICDLRNPATSTDILTNVAVPGASSFDPTDADGTPFSNTLTTLILGGKTQVQRALEANPTFASIWIGNNDVLPFVRDARTNAPTGLAGMTSATVFQTNYTGMLNAMVAEAPNLKGILVGVVQPAAGYALFFPAAAMSNAAFKAGFDQVAGRATALDASCVTGGAGATALISLELALQIRTGAHPPTVACVRGGQTGALPGDIGDVFVLDPAEQATVSARVTAYNQHIQAEANRVGFAYYDPNTTAASLRAAGSVITNIPNLASTTATFGTGMSLDGVHPGAPLHRTIANEMITAINAKYSTTLAPVP